MNELTAPIKVVGSLTTPQAPSEHSTTDVPVMNGEVKKEEEDDTYESLSDAASARPPLSGKPIFRFLEKNGN